MQRINVATPAELIKKLRVLHQEDTYIFRGLPDAGYELTPNSFRKPTMKKLAEKFYNTVAEAEVHSWLKHKKIQESLEWGKPLKGMIDVQKIFNLTLKLMHYNFELYSFYEKNQGAACLEDVKIIDMLSSDYWASQEAFFRAFDERYRSLIFIIDLNNVLIKKPYHLEGITKVDETFPQHYGFPSAALDWSYNSDVALYFAVDNKPKEYELFSDSPFFSVKKLDATYLSIFAYKQLDNSSSPISVIQKHHIKNNLRAKRQEGTFTYFNNTCEYYLKNQSFPSIDAYDSLAGNKFIPKTFEIIRFNLERTENNLIYLNEYLNQKGITKEFLLPGEELYQI